VTTLIKLRIDVDYPYPSRIRSFIYTALGIKVGRDYLKNSKILARMINESPKEVKAYWFFTPKTIPDKELLKMLHEDRHEIALHIINKPYKELELLKKQTERSVNFYTIHGTARITARIIWKRWRTKAPKIPEDYPLQSFYEIPTFDLDVHCYNHPVEEAFDDALSEVEEDKVLHIHPIWLFQRGRINHRGPYYAVLRRILEVDKELETLTINKKLFFRIAKSMEEYEKDVELTEELTSKLRERGVDVFTLIERRWINTIKNPSRSWLKTSDNIALLQITDYDDWWKSIDKKTRNMIRKAEKSGIKTEVVELDEKLVEGIWKIYNETPIRQERAFPHYGEPLEAVRHEILSSKNCTHIGAYFQYELAGFTQLVHGDNVARISQILSLQKYWDKAVNNALVAKAVEICAGKGTRFLIYGRMGNHPTLDSFKQSNNCVKFDLTRFYIPLTTKGRIAAKLGLHREMKDRFPQSVKYPLIPIYNWISRTKSKIKTRS
jgi:hypothetical protein